MKLDVVLVITNEKSGSLAAPLLAALKRKALETGVFITGNGARALVDADLQSALTGVGRVVACSDSWRHCYKTEECPVTQGSQTDHSEMIGDARKVICL